MTAGNNDSPARMLGILLGEVLYYMRPRYRGCGLNGPEAMTLAHLYHLQRRGMATNPSCISDSLAVSRPAVTAVLNSLEERECLRRHPCVTDRRRQEVALTRRGLEVAQEMAAQYDRMMEDILAALEPEEGYELTRLLQKVADHIKKNRREER